MKPDTRKKILFGLFSLFFLSLGIRTSVYAIERPAIVKGIIDNKANNRPYVAGEVIVKFKEDKINLDSPFSLTSEIRKLIFDLTYSYETVKTLKNSNSLLLKIKKNQLIDEAINSLKSDPNVEYVEPNYYHQMESLNINDTYKDNLWGLDNSGQITLSPGITSIGTSGADIDMARAWRLSTGTTEVIVAVIDSGVAYNHPDLIANMWDGTNCVNETGAAISGGCLHGYDFYASGGGDTNPAPTSSGHGTHIAGTIAATQNNSIGVAGVGPKIKIMALKVGFDSVSVVNAIDFATRNGAKIINASYGSPFTSYLEEEAIGRFRDAGGIFVAAAGNDGRDSDNGSGYTSYPADYTSNNIISVAATDQNDNLASFSNFGTTSVDVGAPGKNIYSISAATAYLDESFNTVADGSVPAGWVEGVGSGWGVVNVGGTGPVDNVLLGEIVTGYNYTPSVNTTLTSSTIGISSPNIIAFDFFAQCGTEFTDPLGVGDSASDYMALEISADGSNFNELTRWNSFSLLAMGNGGYYNRFEDLVIPIEYHTNNFKFRLRWVTNGNMDTGTGEGCLVDNFKILQYGDGTNGNRYEYMDGTSMAAPHVAGLAGYLWSVKPSATASEIISNILNNGDTLPSLEGKTVTGRRINAYKSLMDLGVIVLTGPTISGLANDAVPVKSKTLTWSSDNPATDQYRFLIDQTIGSIPTGSYGVGTSTTYSSGSGTFYIHAQAIDVDSGEGPVTTTSFVLDNNGPVATVSNSNPNVFTLSFGETIYSNVGVTFAPQSDFIARFNNNTSEIGISSATYNDQTITVGVTGTPIAGSKISLLSGATNNFYDYLTNVGGSLAIIFDGSNWWANPQNLNVAATNIPDLITTGQLSLTGGSAPETALSMTASSNLTITIGNSGKNSSVGLILGTVISELTDQIFNANLIAGTEVDVATVSNVESGYTPRGVIQWGISGSTLKFSQPVTIRIYLGSSYDGQTLNVYRSPSLSIGWTATGLLSTTCVVSSGYCGFTTTEASYFLAASSNNPTSAPTSIPSNNNNSSNNNQSSSSSGGGGPSCNDRIPLTVPDLFRISTTKGSAKIIYTPVKEKITGYAVIYGHKKGDERYASMISTINNNQGEQNFTINKLNPKITYYFKVAAINGCVSGPWSEWIPAKADRKREIHKYRTIIKNKIKTLINQFK